MDRVFVRLVALPAHVRGFTVTDENGDYNIYLSCTLSERQRSRTYRHELGHIARADFEKTDPVFMIEEDAEQHE